MMDTSVVSLRYKGVFLFSVDLPRPTFDSLDVAKREIGWWGSRRQWGPGSYPCLTCHGSGTVIHPDDEQGDPIEGHKLSRRVGCGSCRGTGHGTKKAFMKYYNGLDSRYKSDLRKLLSELSSIRKILLKLTPKEARLLSRMAFRCEKGDVGFPVDLSSPKAWEALRHHVTKEPCHEGAPPGP